MASSLRSSSWTGIMAISAGKRLLSERTINSSSPDSVLAFSGDSRLVNCNCLKCSRSCSSTSSCERSLSVSCLFVYPKAFSTRGLTSLICPFSSVVMIRSVDDFNTALLMARISCRRAACSRRNSSRVRFTTRIKSLIHSSSRISLLPRSATG